MIEHALSFFGDHLFWAMLQALGSKPWQGSHSERLRSPTANADKDAQSQAQKLFLIDCTLDAHWLDNWCLVVDACWHMLTLAYWPERPEEIFIEVGLLFWGKAASGGSESKGWQQKSWNVEVEVASQIHCFIGNPKKGTDDERRWGTQRMSLTLSLSLIYIIYLSLSLLLYKSLFLSLSLFSFSSLFPFFHSLFAGPSIGQLWGVFAAWSACTTWLQGWCQLGVNSCPSHCRC